MKYLLDSHLKPFTILLFKGICALPRGVNIFQHWPQSVVTVFFFNSIIFFYGQCFPYLHFTEQSVQRKIQVVWFRLGYWINLQARLIGENLTKKQEKLVWARLIRYGVRQRERESVCVCVCVCVCVFDIEIEIKK